MRRLIPLLLLPLALPAAAQDPGRLQERVRAADSSHSYALYLPPGWSPARRWPVLLIADPAGRGALALEPFRAAAADHGWVLLSGWETLANADSADAVTGRALDAMLRDARARWAADERRVYLAGFSGTARIAWVVAASSPGTLAGLVVVGAGLPGPALVWRIQLGRLRPFPVFAAAAEEDFNLVEIGAMRPLLAELGYPLRSRTFPGGHAWPPPTVAGEAIAWLELQAVRGGQATRPAAWVDSMFAAERSAAERMEAADPAAAAAALREAAAGFAGLRDTAGLAARAQRLEASPAAVRAVRARAAAAEAELQFRGELQAWLVRARTLAPARIAPDAERTLALRRLRGAARDSADTETMRSARRRLALLRVWAGFYEPRGATGAGDHARAAAWLSLARSVEEDAPVCTALARARARAGDRGGAVEALGCALRRGAARDALASDELLGPLVGGLP